jgi:hypothetical protein
MRSHLALTIFAGLTNLSLSLAKADHWILTELSTLMIGRMDPIVNPDDVSGHVHGVVGASNFQRRLIVRDLTR